MSPLCIIPVASERSNTALHRPLLCPGFQTHLGYLHPYLPCWHQMLHSIEMLQLKNFLIYYIQHQLGFHIWWHLRACNSAFQYQCLFRIEKASVHLQGSVCSNDNGTWILQKVWNKPSNIRNFKDKMSNVLFCYKYDHTLYLVLSRKNNKEMKLLNDKLHCTEVRSLRTNEHSGFG